MRIHDFFLLNTTTSNSTKIPISAAAITHSTGPPGRPAFCSFSSCDFGTTAGGGATFTSSPTQTSSL